jgi:hypothetical protein
VECVKFLEASNVSTAWQPLSWEHTLMRPTYSSTSIFFFFFSIYRFRFCIVMSFLMILRKLLQYRGKGHDSPVRKKKTLGMNFIKEASCFQNLSQDITVWYHTSQGSQISIHVYTCQLAYSYFLRACYFMVTESSA